MNQSSGSSDHLSLSHIVHCIHLGYWKLIYLGQVFAYFVLCHSRQHTKCSSGRMSSSRIPGRCHQDWHVGHPHAEAIGNFRQHGNFEFTLSKQRFMKRFPGFRSTNNLLWQHSVWANSAKNESVSLIVMMIQHHRAAQGRGLHKSQNPKARGARDKEEKSGSRTDARITAGGLIQSTSLQLFAVMLSNGRLDRPRGGQIDTQHIPTIATSTRLDHDNTMS